MRDLFEEIQELREHLQVVFQQHRRLSHPCVVAVSQLLDKKIIQYYHERAK